MDINYKGIIYTFKREKNEINDIFYNRCWETVKSKCCPKILTIKQLNQADKLSRMKIYNKFYNCTYPK